MYVRRSQLTLRTLIDGLNESTFVTCRDSPYQTQADTVPTITHHNSETLQPRRALEKRGYLPCHYDSQCMVPDAMKLEWSLRIKDNFGAGLFVLYSEAVLWWQHSQCPLYRGCPLVGVSIIGGSTVIILMNRTNDLWTTQQISFSERQTLDYQ